jgi:hypothetical protein
MNVFTTTTKRKVIGLIMTLAAVAALITTIAFALAGEFQHAIPAASLFINIIIFMFSLAAHMDKKDAEAKAAARREAFYVTP